MKFAAFLLALTTILSTCSNPLSNVSVTNQFIEYQLDEGAQVVVVIRDQKMGVAEARQQARQRAAEITVAKGGRYYRIVSEQETKVIRSKQPWPNNQATPQNLYQELIIEKGFGRDQLQRENPSSASSYPAYRLVFEIDEGNPSGKSVDACSLTDCKGL